MREFTKVVRAKVGDFSEFLTEEQQLLKKASEVRLNAQAPYSNYWVGVAVLSGQDLVYWGCNVERCTWTQTIHAEQSAIDRMVADEGPSKIKIVALAAAPAGEVVTLPPEKNGAPLSSIEEIPVPCGHCLQIIWENCLGDPNVKLIALAGNGEVVSTTIGDALPMRFGPEHLGVDYGKKPRN